MTKPATRRVGVSFNRLQVEYLADLVAKRLPFDLEARAVLGILEPAVQRAEERAGVARHPSGPGRGRAPNCRNGHAFTDDNTGIAKRNGKVYRQCLTCRHGAQARERLARKRAQDEAVEVMVWKKAVGE